MFYSSNHKYLLDLTTSIDDCITISIYDYKIKLRNLAFIKIITLLSLYKAI